MRRQRGDVRVLVVVEIAQRAGPCTWKVGRSGQARRRRRHGQWGEEEMGARRQGAMTVVDVDRGGLTMQSCRVRRASSIPRPRASEASVDRALSVSSGGLLFANIYRHTPYRAAAQGLPQEHSPGVSVHTATRAASRRQTRAVYITLYRHLASSLDHSPVLQISDPSREPQSSPLTALLTLSEK